MVEAGQEEHATRLIERNDDMDIAFVLAVFAVTTTIRVVPVAVDVLALIVSGRYIAGDSLNRMGRFTDPVISASLLLMAMHDNPPEVRAVLAVVSLAMAMTSAWLWCDFLRKKA